ncbi:hypothetical protein [Anaerocolumna sp.]|uniref:hypothetical protein n=1 Tax=Anaerocolumna sp. TaxID=2041569 RepID=UPI0028ACDDBB|nr:hypothetical protein [Anaerocolumna sp.]
MKEFDDYEYSTMICDLIHDMEYIEKSNRGKVATIRQYAEVVVRKILNIGSDTQLTLGQVGYKKSFLDKIELLEEKLGRKLLDCIEKIRPTGNDGTHTQYTESFTDTQVAELEDALLDLYSILFLKFFTSVKIDLCFNPHVLSLFSLLPPVVREKTWQYLYELDNNNIIVADKLCLSIIKTHGKDSAFAWLEENRTQLESIPYPTEAEKHSYLIAHRDLHDPSQSIFTLNFDGHDNIYDLLKCKTEDKSTSINESGKLYSNFEEAISHYQKQINLYYLYDLFNGNEELTEINALVQFAYIGRIPTL